MKSYKAIVVVLFLFGQTLFAHDIGLSKTELIEEDNNYYTLRVKKGSNDVTIYTDPRFSEAIELLDFTNFKLVNGWNIYRFKTKVPLTREDIIYLDWARNGVMFKVKWKNGDELSKIVNRSNGLITINLSEFSAGSNHWTASAKFYFVLGVEHILTGWDHLLFVFTLLFLISGFRSLLATITTFTIAHSITLGLATLGYVNLPSTPVEIIIALSIVLICVEVLNAYKGKSSLTHRYPWLLAFAFGLIHGLGFAGALSEIGIPADEVPISLLFFNLGIEMGQIAFVLVILALYKVSKVFSISNENEMKLGKMCMYAAGTMAMYWGIERIFYGFLMS
ncbi:HupE/UreJ family protein [Lutimonas sp.]|uniref:HupE/UreJ family protein n=1 Tax=Lutimonas sp. TaxID=1872403 RepID=UPI003D9ACDDB